MATLAIPTGTLLEDLKALTHHHLEHSNFYRDFVMTRFPAWDGENFESLPFLPTSAFKNRLLKSISDDDVYLEMESSGTSSNGKSRIAIDRETSSLQTKALAKSFAKTLGKERLPMVLVSKPRSHQGAFSASDAAIVGFARFSLARQFTQLPSGDLDLQGILEFLDRFQNKPVVFLGFTYQIWKLLDELEANSIKLLHPGCYLIHGGGWKRLEHLAVSASEFSSRVMAVLGASLVRNYYGMVEQTGTVYFECEAGFLHPPDEGHMIIRHPITLETLKDGERGAIQLQSAIQKSYPGHSILTEDAGFRISECVCARGGPALVVQGRLQDSEIRGCSDALQ